MTVQHNFSKQIAATVHRWVHSERFDFVHLNHIDTVPYTAATGAIPRVIDTHNLLYQYYQRRASLERNLALRALLGRESRQFQKFENEAFSNARFVLVCSREEAESAKGATPDIELDVVPNGVDCEFFKPGPDGKDASSQDLVFVGDMGYGPNQDAVLWFIEAVLPALRERVPGARLVVVGKNPDQTLLEMSSKREDVAVTGYVEDVREWVWSSRISVVPIRYGSGTRLKVLEAFAMGIPTVSTAVGAEGIAYQDGVDVLIANDPESMVHSICRLLSDQALYDTLRRNCRRTAQNRYDWSIIGRQLVDIYQGLLQRSPSQVLDHQQTP